MQTARRPLRTTALLSPLVVLALFPFAPAQKIGIDSTQQSSVRASDREIMIRLRTSDNHVIVASQYDGEMIKTGREGGEMFGITPHILDDGSVTLEFFRINKILNRNVVVGEAVKGVGRVGLDTTVPQSTPIDRIVTVELINISKSARAAGVKINDFGLQDCPCCVTCGGETTCGLYVIVSCGSCACP